MILAAAAAGTATSASAFVPASSWEAMSAASAIDGVDDSAQAPAGANVIGRGIGGLHGDLRAAHDAAHPLHPFR